MKLDKLLKDKNVLYLVVALAILCSFGYVCVSSYECLAVFVVVYFICCNYIKNKIVCILVALFVSNFLFGCSWSLKGSLFEGFSSGRRGPVTDVAVAGQIAEVAGAVAGEKAAEAVAEQGASSATQKEVKEDAKEATETAVTEAMRGLM